MSGPASLRPHDYKPLYMLLGECRHTGAFPQLWPALLHRRIAEWLGVSLTVFFEGDPKMASGRPGQAPRAHACGAKAERLRMVMGDYWERAAYHGDPLLEAWAQLPGELAVRARQTLVPDRVWYQSPGYRDYFARVGVDHLVMARCPGGNGSHLMLNFWRPRGAARFSARETHLLEAMVGGLSELLCAGEICSLFEQGRFGLSGRLHEILDGLLSGQTEKEIAADLGLSVHTVHGYVKAVYERMGVHSRSQLLALASNSWKMDGKDTPQARFNLAAPPARDWRGA